MARLKGTSRRIPMSFTRLAAAFAACTVLAMVSNVAPAAGAKDAAATAWSTYGHDYANTRHADLTQIDVKNVASVVPLWQYQTGQTGSFEGSPIVVGGTMYITTGINDTVIALDARTGTAKWKFQPKLGFTTFCCGSNNRVSWWTMEGIRGHARRIAVRARRRDRRRGVANDGR